MAVSSRFASRQLAAHDDWGALAGGTCPFPMPLLAEIFSFLQSRARLDLCAAWSDGRAHTKAQVIQVVLFGRFFKTLPRTPYGA